MKIEVWKSSENQEERHYFLAEDGNNTYVLGYSPLFFTEEEIEAFLLSKGLRGTRV
jgi:hypothetical protein